MHNKKTKAICLGKIHMEKVSREISRTTLSVYNKQKDVCTENKQIIKTSTIKIRYH